MTPRTAAVLGPGRMGGALALALQQAGIRVTAVAGRGPAALERFAALAPEATASDAVAAAAAADLVVVSVPDDHVAGLVRAVAAAGGVREGSRWIHVAGSLGLAPLRPARLAGAGVAACHPAMTAPDPRTGAALLPGTAWAVTAPEPDRGWAVDLVRRLGGRPFDVADDRRTLYHAALALGANAVVGVVALARDLLAGAGIDDPAAFLEPLGTAAARTAAQQGVAALTGPVRRGDVGTVAAHLAELAAVLPEAVATYRALGLLLVGQARRAGLPADAAAAVAEVLAHDVTAPPPVD